MELLALVLLVVLVPGSAKLLVLLCLVVFCASASEVLVVTACYYHLLFG